MLNYATLLSFTIISFAFATTPTTFDSICVSNDIANLDWRSYDNQVKLNDQRFNIKGVSWFGFETLNPPLSGLGVHNLDWYLQWIVDNDFNALRLPFSIEYILNNTVNQNTYRNVVHQAGLHGILVMVSMSSDASGGTEGFYEISHSNAIMCWEQITDLLKDEWNVFMVDVYSEPHDVTNDKWDEWIQFCEDVSTVIWDKGVNWLIAIEGTDWRCDIYNCGWGEDLEGVRDTNITFEANSTHDMNRFVWSPHVYSEEVTENVGYSEQGWQSHWGYLVDGSYPSNDAAIVVGEFGAIYISDDSISWMDDLITYLINIDARDTFYWSLTPNSPNTGGLLQKDWTTPETEKLIALNRLQPYPSKITYNATTEMICITGLGEYNETGSEVYLVMAISFKYDILNVDGSIDTIDQILINATRQVIEELAVNLSIPLYCIGEQYYDISITNRIDQTIINPTINISISVCTEAIALAITDNFGDTVFNKFKHLPIDMVMGSLWTIAGISYQVPGPPLFHSTVDSGTAHSTTTDYLPMMEFVAAIGAIVLCCLCIGMIFIYYIRRKRQKLDGRDTSKTVDQVNIVVNSPTKVPKLENAPSVSESAHEDRMAEELFGSENLDREEALETIGVITTQNETETETFENVEGRKAIFAEQPLEDMSDNEVAVWVRDTVKLPQYIDNFISNGFDGLDVIMELEIDELKEIGVDLLGHRKRIMKEIALLNHPQLANEGSAAYIR